ncbi:hypothetical protein HUA78_30570 [Myxococcus sp. CA033]|uniref:hypothetical protein n=1 Tax=Myxococcus sp. CA033 TaxID=2741516 RepID=UPI00157A86EE|nr:hypothetical protein [Myxococcus sp. CA033]NTX38797.1 hypothetical protein [Myxococcus sp. CA033]
MGQAGVRDPEARKELYASLKTLATSPASGRVTDVIEKLFKDPEVAKSFDEFKNLEKEILQPAATGLAARLLAENDGDTKAASNAYRDKLKTLDETFSNFGKPLFDGRDGVTQAASAALEDATNGKYSALATLGDNYESMSTGSKLLTAGLIVYGAKAGADKAAEGEYREATKEFAAASKGTAELLAGATKSLVDLGKNAQQRVALRYGAAALDVAEFAAKIAPGIGVAASAASLGINVDKAKGGNAGYALAAAGDVIGVLGGLVNYIPGGIVPGAIASGIGAAISAGGELLGNFIDQNDLADERQRLFAGLDQLSKNLREPLATADSARIKFLTTDLNLKPEQIQALLQDNPKLADGPLGTESELHTILKLTKNAKLTSDETYRLLDGVFKGASSLSEDVLKRKAVLDTFFRYAYTIPAQDKGELKKLFEGGANNDNLDAEFKTLLLGAARALN